MKKYLIILIILFLIINLLYSNETDDITKTKGLSLVIVPPFNISAKKELDYIKEEIKNSLTEKIDKYNYFSIYNWENAEYIFYSNNFDFNKLIFEDDQEVIKKLLGIDFTITGFYRITEGYIHIYLKCFEKKNKVESFTFEYLNDYKESKIKEYIEYSTTIIAEMVVNKYKNKMAIKNKVVDLTSLNKKKISIQQRNIAGYALLASNLTIFIGATITLSLNKYFYPERDYYLIQLLNKEITASQVNEKENSYLSYFFSFLALMDIGLTSSLISIPIFGYGKREMNMKNKIGFAIYSSSVSLFSIGLSFLIFNFSYLSPFLRNITILYEKDKITYSDYEDRYNLTLSLFFSSLCLTATGIIGAIISIPFLLNKEIDTGNKNKSLSLLIEYNKDLKFGLIYRL